MSENNLVPNCDPKDMAPAMISADTIRNTVPGEKPSIDTIKRGQEAEGYLKELCEYYPHDRIAPGLQSAWLPDKELFYVSIHRFPQHTITSRTIIAKATSETLLNAENQCMEIWRGLCKQVEEERKRAKSS